jgi:ATP-binding cassette subfamily C protein
MGMETILRTFSANVATQLLGGVFATFNLALLFWYSWQLALWACGGVLVVLGVVGCAAALQVVYQARIVRSQGEIASLLLQLLSGIAKLRIAGVEARAFARWAAAFSRQRAMTLSNRKVANAVTAFTSAVPLMLSMLVYFLFVFYYAGTLSVGHFLSFTSSLTGFLTPALATTTALLTLTSIVPTYRRLVPILEAVPEVDPKRTEPGDLSGAIELAGVRFRYRPDGPEILQGVSLTVRPGEFVALVGPSGSGKSTILRLLLGFETPAAGAVLYDDRDLAGLDTGGVRRQIGSVLQSGGLTPGSIHSNIVGSSQRTLDDAWRAAEMAGLAADIRAMPMGMQTVISEGAATISGGQRQRLLIARSLVNRPRILLFDEATSALDNRTQQDVTAALDRLRVTRVVIAHRLSTILNADRVYVIADGKVVQSGPPKELLAQPGLFADLARRQRLDGGG